MIKREEDLSSCRFAEVTLRLRGFKSRTNLNFSLAAAKVAKCP